MNERIRELAKESDLDWHKHWNDDESNRVEKFAELIVRECIGICNKIYFDNYPEAYDFERSEEGEAIKEYFGLKS